MVGKALVMIGFRVIGKTQKSLFPTSNGCAFLGTVCVCVYGVISLYAYEYALYYNYM